MKNIALLGIVFCLLSACGNTDTTEKILKTIGDTCKGKVSTQVKVGPFGNELTVSCDDTIWKEKKEDSK